MKREDASSIEDLEKRLAACKRAPWTTLLFVLVLLSLGAVVYYIVGGMSDTTLLICGLTGTVLGGPVWLKLFAFYRHLGKAYEEILAAERREPDLPDP